MDVEPATFVDDAASPEKVHSEGEDDGDQTPALFVTSMPRDVWANPSLGALAALIDEANELQDGDQVHQGLPEDGSDAGSDSRAGITTSNNNNNSFHVAADTGAAPASGSVARLPEDGAALPTISEGAAFPPRNSNALTLSSSSGSSSSSNNSTTIGRQRREELRRRRNDRRASPYAAARPGRGENGGSGAGRGGAVRNGPTAGETQVLMSLWGL